MKMCSQLLVIVSFCLFSRFTASAQGTVYAYQLYRTTGTSPASALGVALDPGTNGYVLGEFASATTINGTTLNNASGWPDFLLMKFKYGSTNAPQWVKAPVTDYAVSNVLLGIDTSANCYVAGGFGGTNLTFGTTSITNYGNPGDHSEDIFLAKYNTSGTFTFVTQAGGIGEDTLGALATDTSGNCYLTGMFDSPTFTAGSSNLVRQSASGGDCFVMKFNSSGSLTWMNQGSYAAGTCLTFDSANNCYVGGALLGPAVFTGLNPSNQITTNFLAKYTSTGTLLWVRGDVTMGNCLDADKAQNLYTAGTFSNIAQFGSITLTNYSASTMFLAKYDTNGNALWAVQLPGFGNDRITGLTIDARTNCWISGCFASTNSPTNTIVVVARYNLNGLLTGISQVSPAQFSTAGGIAANLGMVPPLAGANIWMAGSYATNFMIGSKAALTNAGNLDIFAAWLFVSPQLTTATTGTNVVTSWPAADGTGFELQTNSDLSSTNWNSVSGGSTVNGQVMVTNVITPGVHFYRLLKP